MNLSLKKYFRFDYRKFLVPMLKHGIYRLETFDDNQHRIMTTTFYLDGDVFTELYEEGDQLLAESNKDKVEQHMKTLEERVGSMDVLYTQIQGLITLIITTCTLVYSTIKYGPAIGAGITFGIGAIVVLLRKYLLKGVIWVVKTIILPSIKIF